MKITKQTTAILTNFETINGSILVKPGSQLETISAAKNILARAGVSETFTQQFGIFDVKQFVKVITSSIMKNAEIEFDEEYLTLVKDGSSLKYWYSDASTIVYPLAKLHMPEPEIHFELEEDSLTSVLNIAKILKTPDLALTSDGKTISLSVLDSMGTRRKRVPNPANTKKNIDVVAPYADFSTPVGEGNGDTYVIFWKTQNISKLAKGSYDVSISKQGISHFSNQEIDLEYWITIEPNLETEFKGEPVYERNDEQNAWVNKYQV